jgi:hypothetical protein
MILSATALVSFLMCAQGADNFLSITSGGHSALKSSMEKSNKWLMFPEQKDMHHKTRGIDGVTFDNSRNIIQNDKTFWDNHGADLGLSAHARMRETDGYKGMQTAHKKYDQYINGVRVFGGEFVVTSGAHGGVVHAHGMPLALNDVDLASSGLETIRQKPVDMSAVMQSVQQHMTSRRQLSVSDVHSVGPVELVWHSSRGSPALAWMVSGTAKTDSASTSIVFDAFVNAQTNEVVRFVDKSGAVDESPFASPIDDAAIFVYDQYLKDYNDDHVYDDDYYNQDPDKYTNATLVFDTTSGQYTYPTNDQELNYLVDNTLYIKYMYNSLSNGDYLTWNRTQTDWNIEYNLSIANAYFDGYWGIHFGTGYITDDVVPHEWSHG